MDLPQGDPAGLAALITLVIAAIWKLWLRARSDHRNDQLGMVDRDSHKHIAAGYDQLVEQLRNEVSRLAATVSELSIALDEERTARYHTEAQSNQLQQRVMALEDRLRALGETP